MTITGTLVAGGDVHVSGAAAFPVVQPSRAQGEHLAGAAAGGRRENNFVLDSTGGGDATG